MAFRKCTTSLIADAKKLKCKQKKYFDKNLEKCKFDVNLRLYLDESKKPAKITRKKAFIVKIFIFTQELCVVRTLWSRIRIKLFLNKSAVFVKLVFECERISCFTDTVHSVHLLANEHSVEPTVALYQMYRKGTFSKRIYLEHFLEIFLAFRFHPEAETELSPFVFQIAVRDEKGSMGNFQRRCRVHYPDLLPRF